MKREGWHKNTISLKGRRMEKLGPPFPQSGKRDYRMQRSGGIGEEDSARRVWKSVGITVVECSRECLSKAGRQTAVLEGPPSGHQHEFLMDSDFVNYCLKACRKQHNPK